MIVHWSGAECNNYFRNTLCAISVDCLHVIWDIPSEKEVVKL
eukprot:SAG31_NODE_46865_length_252_cov_1.339869_1_plen_41_part_01